MMTVFVDSTQNTEAQVHSLLSAQSVVMRKGIRKLNIKIFSHRIFTVKIFYCYSDAALLPD